MSDESARISPTAHYTGHVWYRHGLSHPALRTRAGRAYFHTLQPLNLGYHWITGGPTLEAVLLARHRAIDSQLSAAIRAGRVGQVMEVASGMSPRGLRFSQAYPQLRYVEADLRDMSERKRAALEAAGALSDRHRVVYVDALRDDGPHSLEAVAAQHLDPGVGTAVITEGLVNYFDRATIEALWARIARVLHGFPSGQYLSDIHLRRETMAFAAARAFTVGLRAFAKGAIHYHFRDEDECLRALHEAGFVQARVDPPIAYGVPPASPRTENDIVRVVEAET